MKQTEAPTIGFIGLGVMGGPMCANIAAKHDAPVYAYDLDAAALSAAEQAGGNVAGSIAS